MLERRTFLTKAGTAAVLAAATVADAPSVIAQPRVQWRMSTAWPPQLDNLQGSAAQLARVVEEMSGGRFRIEVYPGGQIMPPFECFGATSKGTIEAFMAASSYWSAMEPAADWFISIPFGMDPQGMAIWYQDEGRKLWEETYAPHDVIPRLGPGFAPQMGGWFRKKIASIADYKGLKMRIAGLGSKVIAWAGAAPVLTPAADIYASSSGASSTPRSGSAPTTTSSSGCRTPRATITTPAGTNPAPWPSSASTAGPTRRCPPTCAASWTWPPWRHRVRG
jgi:TRAP-type mannitol/chloroaromatic compound transport system substrate-binding protein